MTEAPQEPDDEDPDEQERTADPDLAPQDPRQAPDAPQDPVDPDSDPAT